MRRRLLALVVSILAVFAAGCDLRTLVPEGPAPLRYRDTVFTDSQVSTTSNVVYGSAVDQTGQTVTLRLDVYRPSSDTVTQRPAIVWIHGGGFSGGTKTSPEIVEQARLFARKGYTTVSINYRLWSGGCFPPTQQCLTAIEHAKFDAQAAVRFLRANADTYDVDPNRIATAGTSAGAITALNVGYGPETVGNSGNPGFPSTVRAAVSLSGAAILTTPNAGEAAGLLFHGDQDGIVQYSAAVNTTNAAQSAGLTVFLTTWPGAGHVPYTQNRTQIHNETTNFLYWTLDLANAAR